jgi:large subunit ribosomal protein L21
VGFAVIGTGGKQYRVSEGDLLQVERLEGNPGENVTFDEVLLIGGEDGIQVGTPRVSGAQVRGTILDQVRGPKVLVFKKKRRKQYRRTRGHRQDLTAVRIDAIQAGS